MPHIIVSPLSRLAESATRFGARDMITLINIGTPVVRPVEIAEDRHLFLGFNDIIEPTEGMTHPVADHVSDLLAFGRHWDRKTPLLIHCFAGISRSTAGAYITALALNPELDEVWLAQTLRRNSPSATPNSRLDSARRRHAQPKGSAWSMRSKRLGAAKRLSKARPFMLPLVV